MIVFYVVYPTLPLSAISIPLSVGMLGYATGYMVRLVPLALVAKFYGLMVSYAFIASFSYAIDMKGRLALGVKGLTPTT